MCAQTALIDKIFVHSGQQVQKGTLLLVLDSKHLQMELEIQLALLKSMQLQIPAKRGELLRLQSVEAERKIRQKEQLAVEVARARATLLQDKAELSLLKQQKETQEKWVQQQLANGKHLDDLSLRFTTLSQKVAEGKHLLAQVEANFYNAKSRIKNNGNDASERQITAPLAAQATVQKERIKKLEMNIQRHKIYAIRNGIIGQIFVQAGDTALKGKTLLELHAPHSRQLVAYANEQEISHIRLKHKVVLTSRTAGEPSRYAQVVALGPTFEELPIRFRKVPTEAEYARRIFLELDDKSKNMTAGQFFDAQIIPEPYNENARASSLTSEKASLDKLNSRVIFEDTPTKSSKLRSVSQNTAQQKKEPVP